jgi:uncharacterized coiled-coil protein SlyX
MQDVTALMELSDKIAKKREEINKLAAERDLLIKELSKKCSHPIYKETRDYYPGGYYDRSSVTINHTCTICGKVLKSYDDKNHYGTFG